MKLYEESLAYIFNHTQSLTQEILDKHYLTPYRIKSLDETFKIAVESIVDAYGGYKNSIDYENELKNPLIKTVMCDYHLSEFIKQYNMDDAKLYKDFLDAGLFKESEARHSRWKQFSQSNCQMASFIGNNEAFSTIEEMFDYFEKFSSVEQRIILGKQIESRIPMWGFAMACNWLKDIGVRNFCKPDRHLRIILSGINNTDLSPDETFRKADLIANTENVNIFKLDRILYLIGSGDFYSHSDLGSDTVELLKQIKLEYRQNMANPDYDQAFIDYIFSQG
ncbi:MAG: hypothetical protein LKG21_01675 [Ruminococcus sp.]|nr:hypothetical protein [Ruminococcus sp.]